MGVIRDDILPVVRSLVEGFNQLPTPIKDTIVVAAALVAAVVPLAVGFAGLLLAVNALSASLPALVAVWGSFTAGLAIATPILIPLAGIVAAVTAAVAALKIGMEASTGSTVTWGDTIRTLGDAMANPLKVNIDLADVAMKGFMRDQLQLNSIMADAKSKVDAAGKALQDHATALKANTSAANIAADVHNALKLTFDGERQAISDAQAQLDIVTQKWSLGTASAADLAKALADLKAAQSALAATQKEYAPVVDALAVKTAAFRNEMARLGPQYAIVQTAAQAASTSVEANAVALQYDAQQALLASTNLERVMNQFDRGAISGKAVEDAVNALTAAQDKYNKALGEAPVSTEFNPEPIREVQAALSAAFSQLDKFPPFIPTLATVDEQWTKQSGHVNKLAKTDLPAAITAYNTYIAALEAVGAPLGQIYAAQEKELGLEIAMASERGTDATAQIIQLTNIKEQTQALSDASQALGNVYVGLVKTFNDAFTEFGSQVSQAITGAESFQKAWTNVIQKIAQEIIGTLVNYALVQLKDALIGIMGGLGGLGGAIGSAVGKIGGSVAGSAGTAATTAAMTAAVTSFTAAIATFTADTGIMTSLASVLATTVSAFASTVAAFATTVAADATAVGAFATSVGVEATTTGVFVGAVTAFTAAVATFAASEASSSIMSGLGGLFTLFGFQGGGEVPGTVLALLHPQEMVLPPSLANVVRGLAASGGSGVSAGAYSTPATQGVNSSQIVQINLNNAQFHGVSPSTVNNMMDAVVKSVRRAGARW
jgi:hypothetical protein